MIRLVIGDSDDGGHVDGNFISLLDDFIITMIGMLTISLSFWMWIL